MSAPKSLRDVVPAAVPSGALLSRAEAQAVIEQVVKMSKADSINVSLGTNWTGNVRFADNQMSTAGSVVDAGLAVQSSYGPKHAVVTTNDLSEASLRRCVEQSERLAKLAPDDPEAMPELEPQRYVDVKGYIDTTANVGAAERAQAALTALAPARKEIGRASCRERVLQVV